jgi:hypothetical protein
MAGAGGSGRGTEARTLAARNLEAALSAGSGHKKTAAMEIAAVDSKECERAQET